MKVVEISDLHNRYFLKKTINLSKFILSLAFFFRPIPKSFTKIGENMSKPPSGVARPPALLF
jgi:hypothetical protein